ncbi:MAG: hypothetical protein GKS00_14025 [Alphaproteobacteria bacterium]|nr:hypothetical protein [Alphaproteobacteria bacterium]
MGVLLGCIADDFTGATDLAGTLVREGMRTVQMIDIPSDSAPDVDAVVIALKSRTTPVGDAVAESLAALAWLREAGCRQFFFKYCSTFDSTDDGNIGPVGEALLEALGDDFTIACPAFPRNARTICKGYLFVGDVLLNESGMQDHPLTPMTDANLVRVLERQTKGGVGLVDYAAVRRGALATMEAFSELRQSGTRFAVVDALDDADLVTIGEACADMDLVTGGSGVAIGLPENFRRQGLLDSAEPADILPDIRGHAAVLAGSCSRATREQIAIMSRAHPALKFDPMELNGDPDVAARALDWARPHLSKGPVLIYASADPEEVQKAQEALGAELAGKLVEDAMAEIARGLVAGGVRRLIVAGGETSGAVVGGLGITGLRIGPEIDPGVPWTASLGETPLLLALKSGNFGAPDFFTKAFGQLP